MGYFSNGSEGEYYEAKYCRHCVHYDGCAVMLLHLLYNYDECNKKDSFLHLLIPYEGGYNLKCRMYHEAK